MDEETLTQSILLDLQENLDKYLDVESYSHYVESRETGADWEWWFCDGVGRRMFGMRVQAKKLKPSRRGPSYDFGYTPKGSDVRQVDRLVNAADAADMPAVYALYNGAELDLSTFPWECCRDPDAGLFGVSLLSAQAAQEMAIATRCSLDLLWAAGSWPSTTRPARSLYARSEPAPSVLCGAPWTAWWEFFAAAGSLTPHTPTTTLTADAGRPAVLPAPCGHTH
jgi:hypothetical protein